MVINDVVAAGIMMMGVREPEKHYIKYEPCHRKTVFRVVIVFICYLIKSTENSKGHVRMVSYPNQTFCGQA